MMFIILFDSLQKKLQKNVPCPLVNLDPAKPKNDNNYSLRKQRLIPIACCALHNFIRRENTSDRLFGDFDV